MLPYYWYLLKVIICSGILFGYYWFFLRNKIFHQYNRFYLLAAMSLSLLLPLLKINIWQPAAQQNQAIRVLQAVSAGDEYMSNIVITAQRSNWSFEQLYTMVYWLVCIIFFFILIRTLYLIRTLLKRYPVQQIEQVSFVNTDDESTPFSFLKYIFWNSSIDINTTTGRQIFKHEVAHIQEKHTYDKLFVNIVLIFCWCNPFFWLYRKELNMIHEFIADKKAVEDSDTSAFAAMILQAAYPRHRFELANNFFYSPIKRRLLMLTKIDNPRISYFARLMVLPLAVLVFAAFTFKAKNNHASIYHGKKITVIIDAGHGGKDAGAISADGIFEKDLTLAIAKKVKELNSNDAIEIVLTRAEDVYMNAQEKAAFAKSKNADLVISFHIDNGPKESANTKTGMSVFVAKDEFANAVESKILASAIINEFSTNYGLPVMPQPTQRQGSVWILQANTCPSILVEAGFINNDKDIAYLKTETAKVTIAKNVLAAIEKYLTGKPVITSNNIADTIPTLSPSDVVALKTAVNNADSFDYYKKYGGEATYRGQKIKSVFIRNSDNKAVVEFVNGKQMIMSQAEAFKAKIIMPPPPPPPPPPGMYTDDKRPESLQKNGLIVVDGNIQDENYLLDNSNILSVNIIKGDDAIARYGERGKYGVIEITSKKSIQAPAEDKPDTEKALYVVNGKILGKGKAAKDQASKMVAEKVHVKWLKKSEAIAKYGKMGVDGACEVTYTNGEISSRDNVQINDIVASQKPILYLGATSGGSIQLDYLKSIKEISMSTGYKLVSATMYFEGPGFDKNVVQVILNSNSLSPAATSINRCKDGAIIVFSSVKVADENGVVKTLIAYNPVFFVGFLNKAQSNTTKKTLEALDLQKEKQIETVKNNIVFTKAEVNPQFTGGDEAWKKYLRENIQPVIPVDEGWKAGKYTVTVKFIVHTDGTVSDIITENYKGGKTAQHCIDVIKNAPKWQPAVQNGRKVNAYKKQPITFVIEE